MSASGRETAGVSSLALCVAILFGLLCSSCATVDATVEKVKSGVTSRFGDSEKPASNKLHAEPSDTGSTKGVAKPILVDVQEKLQTLGYFNGPINGKLNSRTEAAIQDFQLDNDMRINGRPSESLVKQLDKALELN